VNERRTVVGGGLIGHCVSPNHGERSTRMHDRQRRYRPKPFLLRLLLLICKANDIPKKQKKHDMANGYTYSYMHHGHTFSKNWSPDPLPLKCMLEGGKAQA